MLMLVIRGVTVHLHLSVGEMKVCQADHKAMSAKSYRRRQLKLVWRKENEYEGAGVVGAAVIFVIDMMVRTLLSTPGQSNPELILRFTDGQKREYRLQAPGVRFSLLRTV